MIINTKINKYRHTSLLKNEKLHNKNDKALLKITSL